MAATSNSADAVGMLDEIGTIEEGKLADLIVMAGNPLENLRTSEAVLYTMVNGRLYDAATLDEVAPGTRWAYSLGPAWHLLKPVLAAASGNRITNGSTRFSSSAGSGAANSTRVRPA